MSGASSSAVLVVTIAIAVAARRIAKKEPYVPDRDGQQLKAAFHSAANARFLNSNRSRCQTSSKASASASIKPSW